MSELSIQREIDRRDIERLCRKNSGFADAYAEFVELDRRMSDKTLPRPERKELKRERDALGRRLAHYKRHH